MESRITSALRLTYHPVAVTWADKEPSDALAFKKGKWGCVMSLFAQAAKGRIAVFSRETFGCWGGGVGLGFGNQYLNVPGGIDAFYHFLSIGNIRRGSNQKIKETFCHFLNNHFLDQFMRGERYLKSPEQVKRFVESLPIIDVPSSFVCFKPLVHVDINKEKPVVVVFVANPNQLSALVILANFGRNNFESVVTPFAAACQAIGIIPYREAESANPRAVVGLIDITARKNVRSVLGNDIFTFAVPLKMFHEMEEHVEESFLRRDVWKYLSG